MKACSKCGEIKPLDAFYAQKDGLYGRKSYCKACATGASRAYHEANKDAMNAKRMARAKANKESENERKRAWAATNTEAVKAAKRTWNANNLPVIAEFQRRRNAQKRNAFPRWADVEAIREVYRTAAFAAEAIGEAVHVDHIVPLQSLIVCGLHVPANLRILSARENTAKGNRHWPDMP